ncbi:MAG: MarR family transcriptional regulator [Chloroflexi bacterium]|nr:MarR family transcriptional regulator [Chloroflexota bacterium]
MTAPATEDNPILVEEIQRLLLELMWYERRRFSQELSQLGLTMPQLVTLNLLHEAEGNSPIGALAEMAQQCSATMTGIVDRLVRLALVERRRSARDRRSVLVSLTPAGRALIERIHVLRRERTQRILAHLSPDERAQALLIVRAYMEAARAEDEATEPCR